MYFEHYTGVLDVFQKTRIDSELKGEDFEKAKNVSFRVHDQGIARNGHNNLGLSTYYNKRYVLTGGVHAKP